MFFSDLLKKIPHLTHCFFGRKGGISKGNFLSLNCSFDKGDHKNHVKKNRSIAMNSLGLFEKELITLKQIHSNIAVQIEDYDFHKLHIKADAIITTLPKITLGILTADCAPILLSSMDGNIIGAVHSGWKGALNGIISNTIIKMKSNGAKEIVAAIGPCIQPNSYEVGTDVYESFCKKDIKNKHFFDIHNKKIFFDLPSFIKFELKKKQVKKIDTLSMNTLSDDKNFFSYRRQFKKKCNSFGCQLSIIRCNKYI